MILVSCWQTDFQDTKAVPGKLGACARPVPFAISRPMQANSVSLAGKSAIIFGVANKRSIAWAIAQAWHNAGARLAFTYQGERLKENVEELVGTFGPDTLILECDVAKDDHIARVFSGVGQKFGKLHLMLHSVAFAP